MAPRSEHSKLKAALSRAQKRGPLAALAECRRAFALFDTIGWPDDWAMWDIAARDALQESEHGCPLTQIADMVRAPAVTDPMDYPHSERWVNNTDASGVIRATRRQPLREGKGNRGT